MEIQQIDETVNGKTYKGDIITVYKEMLHDLPELSREKKSKEELSLEKAWFEVAKKMTKKELDEMFRMAAEANEQRAIKYKLSTIKFLKKRLKVNAMFIGFGYVMLFLSYCSLLVTIATLNVFWFIINSALMVLF